MTVKGGQPTQSSTGVKSKGQNIGRSTNHTTGTLPRAQLSGNNCTLTPPMRRHCPGQLMSNCCSLASCCWPPSCSLARTHPTTCCACCCCTPHLKRWAPTTQQPSRSGALQQGMASQGGGVLGEASTSTRLENGHVPPPLTHPTPTFQGFGAHARGPSRTRSHVRAMALPAQFQVVSLHTCIPKQRAPVPLRGRGGIRFWEGWLRRTVKRPTQGLIWPGNQRVINAMLS